MAKIYCVNTPIYRPGINYVGDIIDILDDDVHQGDCNGNMTIIKVPGVLASELKSKISKMINSIISPMTSDPTDNRLKWHDKDSDSYYEVKSDPKYFFNITSLNSSEIDMLRSKETRKSDKLALLDKFRINLKEISINKQSKIDLSRFS